MEVRIDRLIGRMVTTANHRRLGRVAEIRVEPRGSEYVVAAYVLGRVGFAERLGTGVRLLVGHASSPAYVARWDQLDISDLEHPRLLCPVKDLMKDPE
jgi:hypothetical protein